MGVPTAQSTSTSLNDSKKKVNYGFVDSVLSFVILVNIMYYIMTHHELKCKENYKKTEINFLFRGFLIKLF